MPGRSESYQRSRHFAPLPDPVQVGMTGREPNIVEVDAADRRNTIVINQSPAVALQQVPQFFQVCPGEREFHLSTRCQVTARDPLIEQAEVRICVCGLAILILDHRGANPQSIEFMFTYDSSQSGNRSRSREIKAVVSRTCAAQDDAHLATAVFNIEPLQGVAPGQFVDRG